MNYFPALALPALTGFISVPILTRLFTPAEYGLWALADGLSDFLLVFGILSLGASVIRFFPAFDVSSELPNFFAALVVTVGGVSSVFIVIALFLLFLLRSSIPEELFSLLVISLLIFAVQSLFRTFMPVLRAKHKSGFYTVFELTTRYGSLGLGLLLVIMFGFRVDGLLWGTLLAFALVIPALFYVATRGVRFGLSDFRLDDGLKLWRYGWPLALGGMAMWGLRISDRYILSVFRSAEEVGMYSVSYNISSKSIDMLVLLLLFSTGPLVMNTWESKGEEATKRSLEMIARVFLVVCLPAAVGLSMLAQPFVALLTDPAYHEGYRIVGPVALSSFVWGLSQIASVGTLIRKQTKRIAANQLAASGINIGLNILLIPRIGFVAAGFTTLVGFSVLLVLQAYVARSYLKWQFPLKTLRNVAIATASMAIVILRVEDRLEGARSWNISFLVLVVLAGVASYSFTLLVLERAEVIRFWRGIRAGEFDRIRVAQVE